MRFLPAVAALLLVVARASALPVINEVQSTNNSLPDQYGQLMDWVEIHNPTGAAINLQGYYLSDSTSNRTKFTFPAGTTLAAGQFLIVWCGQAAEFTTTGPYPPGQVRATNFNISSGGEPIVLTAPDASTTVDEFPAQAIGAGRTLGRGTGANLNTLFFYDSPTFGAANTTTGTPTATPDAPLFSVPAGIYTNGNLSVAISLPGSVPSGVIRYTLDGSEPTTNSPVYGGPLTLNASTTTNNNSYIPTNLDGNPGWPLYEGWQPPASPPFRINVLRARVFASGAAGRVQTASYLQHSSGTNRYTMPVVSVATDPANMFSNDRGIYVPGWYNNMFQEGSAWERPGNIEFFETDGSLAFAGTIGLRLHGNTTRSRPRKSLRIYARNPYGESVFQHRIFPQKDIERFDTFLLRNGGNDWGNSLFRDALVTTLAEPTGLDIQSSRPAAVFISGEYWGIHNLRDRIDEGYFFHHYGLGTTSFSQIEVIPTGDNSMVAADNGSTMGVDDFQSLLSRAASTGFASETDYAHLASRIDIDNYIDYNAFEIWSGNTDWPGNNYRLWRSVTADTSPGANPRHDGRWRWILFDTDFGLGADFYYVPGHSYDVTTMAQFNSLAHATSTAGEVFSNKELATRLFRRALENTGFRNKFINRFADLLNTRLSAAHATAKLDEFVALYGPGVPEHVNRWRQPYDWDNDIARIRTYMQQRPAAVRGHIAGKFGLAGTAQLGVALTNTNHGVLSVNTVRIESSTHGIGTNVANWTGTYFRGVPVTLRAEAKPGYRFVAWSNNVASSGGGVIASDAAASYSSWTNGANGGTGFGPWSLNTSTGDRNRAGTFLNNGRGGWGMYANDEELSWAYRSLSNALQVGQTFSLRWRHGWVDWPGDVGFELANSSGGILFKLACYWWSDTYVINDSITDIPVTTSPLDIEVTLVTSNTYSARIMPVGGSTFTNTGTFFSEADRAVRRFLAYNYSAGNGGDADVFVTSMQVTAPSGDGSTNYALFSTNATITPTLTNAANFIATFAVEPATTLSIVPPAVGAAGTPLGTVQVRAINSIGDPDGNYQGPVTLTVTGPNGFSQVLQGNAANGVAEFTGLTLPRSGSYQFNAVSGSLAAAPTASLSANDAAVFLPTNNAVWHAGGNWDTGTVPNGTRAVVTIPANPAAERNVTNNAPTTVASINFDHGGSAFRNRINGTAGQPLTLQSADGISMITVTGTGTGHANIEVAGGVVLSNPLVLDVHNIGSTNAEYGALRLQGAWSGSGEMIKRGPGMAGITGAGKTFSGQVIVEQGVLTFSEPAISGNNMTNYTVQPGGQLRLSSAGNPRSYLFKGPLNLAGSGRSGVPDNENLGVLGALRLETGSTGTVAVLTNNVHLTASADIHVPAGNAIQLDGPLTAAGSTNVLAKSGGGTLVLSSASSAYTGGLAVNRGTLQLGGALLTNTSRTLVLTNETTLTGTGRWGGALDVRPGATIAAALGASPAAAPLRAASVDVGGPATVAVTVPSNAVAGRYPILAADSGMSGAANLSLSLTPSNFPYAALAVSSNVLHLVLADAPPGQTFADWAGGAAADSDDDGNGYTALAEFALGAEMPGAAFTLPSAVMAGEGAMTYLTLTAVVRTNSPGLTVTGQTAASLGSGNVWSADGVEVSATTDGVPADFEQRTYRTPATNSAQFLRLHFQLDP